MNTKNLFTKREIEMDCYINQFCIFILRWYLDNILWKKKFIILTDLTLIFSFSFEKKKKHSVEYVTIFRNKFISSFFVEK